MGDPTATLADEFEAVAGDETILRAVIGTDPTWDDADVPNLSGQPHNQVLDWEQARRWLGYESENSWDSNSVYAWTATRVLFLVNYDTWTHVQSVPRHPIDIRPEFVS